MACLSLPETYWVQIRKNTNVLRSLSHSSPLGLIEFRVNIQKTVPVNAVSEYLKCINKPQFQTCNPDF